MGGKEVENKTATPQDILDYLDELFAYALSIGMTYDQYWRDDPLLINAYIKADEIKLRRINYEAWLQGFYVYKAVGDLAPIFNPFSKETKARRYFKNPIPLTEKEREDEEKRKLQNFINYMDSLAIKSQK